jgi:hypothetical protein
MMAGGNPLSRLPENEVELETLVRKRETLVRKRTELRTRGDQVP